MAGAGFPAILWAPGSLLEFRLAGSYAGDGDALPSAPQRASLALRHCLLLAVRFHTDANPFFLTLGCFSADTFAALSWKISERVLMAHCGDGRVKAHYLQSHIVVIRES